jgi:elongation factor Ts
VFRRGLRRSQLLRIKQAFIKNPDPTVKDLVSSKIAELGETIIIRRSTRYLVGEDLGAME